MKLTLSLAKIVKNEEHSIERALRGARLVCDELIVVDTGSSDRTVELAEMMGAKVRHFAWIDDFSAARNYSFEQCTSDWILLLDADDELPKQTVAKILELKELGIPEDIDVYEMVYNYSYDSNGHCTESQFMPRLIRNVPWHRWTYPVHEQLFWYHSRSLQLGDISIEHRQDKAVDPLRHQRARRIVAKAIANGDERTQMVYYHAHHLFLDGEWAEAIRYFEQYLQQVGAGGYAYTVMVNMAQALERLGDVENALLWAKKAEALDPMRAEALVVIGQTLSSLKRWEEAIPFLQRATRLSRPNVAFAVDFTYTWLPWDLLSMCYDALGKYQEAIESAAMALTFGAEMERIRTNIGLYTKRLSASEENRRLGPTLADLS